MRHSCSIALALHVLMLFCLFCRAVLGALCCCLEKGQYRQAGRDLQIEHHDISRHKDQLVDLIKSNDLREVCLVFHSTHLSSILFTNMTDRCVLWSCRSGSRCVASQDQRVLSQRRQWRRSPRCRTTSTMHRCLSLVFMTRPQTQVRLSSR